jgi:hypothetical protein
MPSLRELANNVSTFNYYSGPGNFTQNNVKYPDPEVLFGPEASLMLKRRDFRWSPSNFDDGFVPFGVITRARRAIDDTLRIGKFLTRSTTGLLFSLKQQALQASNPQIEYDPSTSPLRDFGPTRIFTPLPLLAQVAGNAVGTRFMRHGIFPKTSNSTDYETYILKKDSENKNRLVILSDSLGNSNTSGYYSNILTYKSGPNSFNGLGDTTIKRYYRSMWYKTLESNKGFIPIPIENLLSIKPEGGISIIEISPGIPAEPGAPDVPSPRPGKGELGLNVDFRAYKNLLKQKGVPDGVDLPTSNYKDYNLETRVGIAKPRSASQKSQGIRGEKNNVGTADRVNLASLFYGDTFYVNKGTLDFNNRELSYNPSDSPNNGPALRDVIKFVIKSVDNNSPTKGIYMVFRAYIVNIKRSVQAKWNPYNYVGRGESFYVYDGFGETISFSFNIAASSRLEMKPLYQKLNYLISTLAPDYSPEGRIRGSISELTIGNFLTQQPGIITNLDMSIDEDSNWETALDSRDQGGVETDMLELPHIIKCSMTFIPIYNFLPKKDLQVPFIGIDNFVGIKRDQRWLNGGETAKYKNNKIAR